MAHFAELDENNVVLRVIVVDNSDCCTPDGVEKESIGIAHCEWVLGGRWVQTSYNGNFRKNFAGIGFTYDEERDAFIPPKPEDRPSHVIDEETCEWVPPIPRPADHGTGDPIILYSWNEETLSWEGNPLV